MSLQSDLAALREHWLSMDAGAAKEVHALAYIASLESLLAAYKACVEAGDALHTRFVANAKWYSEDEDGAAIDNYFAARANLRKVEGGGG